MSAKYPYSWEEFLELPEGIFRVKYRRQSSRSLKNFRTRLLGKAEKLRRDVFAYQENLKYTQAALERVEAMLSNLTEEKIRQLEEKEKQKEREIFERANQFLKEYLGDENFEKLYSEGHLVLTGADGRTYRVKKDGNLQLRDGGKWVLKCVIKPNLPVPDIVAAVFTAAKYDKSFLKSSHNILRQRR